ncbi:MAG: hypothetical protein JSV42_01970 [Chloroflexota bacterium]|nr:MAG: hypothetical protein JSV42_01970 [Chloroflexota bacterium]
MTIRSDPENNEIRALFDLDDFSLKHVLEIGCGDDRLTLNQDISGSNPTGVTGTARE